MPSGVYDRTKSKPNAGLFKKGERRSPATEIKKGQRFSPATEFKPGIGNGLPNGHGKYDIQEYRMKQSISHRGQHNSPETEIKPGQRISPATEFSYKTRGSNHPRWQGGITPVNIRARATIEYIQWRKAIYERDNYTCQMCGQRGGELHAHHIKSFSKHPELRTNINNGITLCKSCHKGGGER